MDFNTSNALTARMLRQEPIPSTAIWKQAPYNDDTEPMIVSLQLMYMALEGEGEVGNA